MDLSNLTLAQIKAGLESGKISPKDLEGAGIKATKGARRDTVSGTIDSDDDGAAWLTVRVRVSDLAFSGYETKDGKLSPDVFAHPTGKIFRVGPACSGPVTDSDFRVGLVVAKPRPVDAPAAPATPATE